MRFSASVFFVYQPHMTPESYSKRFSNSVLNRNTSNLGYESEIHMKSIYEKKNGGQKSCATVLLAQVFASTETDDC
jgi:hypothetical protein